MPQTTNKHLMIIILGLFIECAAHRKHPCNRCLYASINNHKVQSKGENWIYDDVRHFHGCFMQPQFMTTVGVWREQPTATDYDDDDDDGSWAIHIDVGTHTQEKKHWAEICVSLDNKNHGVMNGDELCVLCDRTTSLSSGAAHDVLTNVSVHRSRFICTNFWL